MKTLVSLIKEQTSDFNPIGRIVTVTVLAIILGCALSVFIGLAIQLLNGEPVHFKY